MSTIKNVTCVGAGTIGSSWAAYFLMHDLNVIVMDIYSPQLEIAKEKINSIIDNCVELSILSREKADSVSKNIQFTDNIKEALKNAEFIQESALESYEVKGPLIKDAFNYAPDNAIYASSSSGLLASKLQSFSTKPENVTVAHPYNPPHLIPLVEIVRGNASDDTIERAVDFYTTIGKKPIVINKELPGHVANRMQAAVWRESIDLVVNGVCSVKDVDTALCNGPGLRWALLGQNMIFHLGGGKGGINHFLDMLGPAHETWWEDMAKWDKLPSDTREKLVNGIAEELDGRDVNDIIKWRDRTLVELMKLRNIL